MVNNTKSAILFPLRKNLLLFASIICFLTIFAFFLAVFLYPGEFELFKSYPSEITRRIASNGQSNIISFLILAAFSVMYSLSQIILYVNFAIDIKSRIVTRILSIGGVITGILTSFLFIILSFTPVDMNGLLHNTLIVTASSLLSAVVILFMLSIFLDHKIPKYFGYLFSILFIYYIGYGIAIIFASQLGPEAWISIVSFTHTIAICLETLIYGLICIFYYLHLRTNSFTNQNTKNVSVL